MSAPISICMIVRNESGQLEACLKSIRPHVKEICIVDTGSEDNTPTIAKAYADKFLSYSGCNDSKGRILDFSDARQKSFSLSSMPWVMWIDGDDEVRGAEHLKSIIEERDANSGGNPVQVMFPYEYAHNAEGKVVMRHYRERLMKPKESFGWVNAVHEVITCNKPGLIQTKTDLVTIVHKRDTSGKVIESGRNLRILKAMYEKHGDSDARHLYYLGLEYINNGDAENSIKFLTKYIDLSGWDDEKYMACLKLIDIFMARGAYEEAIKWCMRAVIINERWGEAYFQLAKCYYFLACSGKDVRRNWERCVHFGRHGLSLPVTDTVLFVNPLERNVEIHKYLNVALNGIGDVPGALASTEQGLVAAPNEAGLDFNRKIYEKHLLSESVKSVINKMVEKTYLDPSSKDVIISALEGRRVQVSPLPQPNVKSQDGLRITMFVGQGVESWNPVTAGEKGIGGSETAVIEMAKRLSSLGNEVTVYGHCSVDHEGVFDGVAYVNSSRLSAHECDVLISSRRPEAVDDSLGIKAKLTVLWVHDVHCGANLTHERALKFDKILALTNWHKSNILTSYPYVHPDQVIVTRNGIDLSRFSVPAPKRNPKKAVYSSSPDRGLQVAIQMWPKVREQIPDAELHVYYGFDVWEACSQNDPGQLGLIQFLKKLLEDNKENGVVYHGRVDQKTLAKEYMESGVWAYPTWFTETSCQLAGSLISTRNGMKPIEDIQVGDLVLTHQGRFRPVTKLIKKEYDGPLYSMRRHKDNRSISLTGEHPIYVANFHLNESSKGNRVYSRKNDRLSWKTPGNLIPRRDYLTTPKMQPGSKAFVKLSDYVDMPVVDGTICHNHNSPICRPVDDVQYLTEDFMYLLGLFAAEGCVSQSPKRHGKRRWYCSISFAFHRKETQLIKSVTDFFGRGSIRPNSENGVTVTVYSSPWANFLKKVIGTGRQKKIPDFVWDSSLENQTAFLRGMRDGDGSKSVRPGRTEKGYSYHHYTSISPSLAYGAAQILTNIGFYPSIHYDKSRDAFDLMWSEEPGSKQYKVINDETYCTRLKNITINHYSGIVYNFEVEEDESYVTDRTIVHNCITAMEAQAAGLSMVTSPIAALCETVADRGVLVQGDWLSPEYQSEWVKSVIHAMKKTTSSHRKKLRDYAFANFGWDSLADEWNIMLKAQIKKVQEDVMVPYMPASRTAL